MRGAELAGGWPIPIVRCRTTPIPKELRMSKSSRSVKKVVLAYSGGLDTSIILKWLQEELRLRGRDLHRRPRPGRGAGARPQEGGDARHQAAEHLHRGSARGVRARLRLPDVPGERALRGHLPARHLDRAAADRQEADRHRARRPAPTPSATAPPARATTRCASSSPITRWSRASRSSRPGASGTSRAARTSSRSPRSNQIPVAKDKRGEAPFSVDANLLHSSSEGKVLEDPAVEPPPYVFQRTVSPEEAPDKATIITVGFKKGDAVSVNGNPLEPRQPARHPQRLRPRQRHRPRRPRGEPLRRHEVARHLRDAGRHHPVARAPGDRIDHARPRRDAPQGRADAALRGADLLRLLVLARARDAAGGDRQEPGARRGRGAPEALQGQRDRRRAARARKSLYSSTLVTFEDDKGAYDQKDAEGFIKLNALRLRTLGMRDRTKR